MTANIDGQGYSISNVATVTATEFTTANTIVNSEISTTGNVTGINVIGTYLYGDGSNITGINVPSVQQSQGAWTPTLQFTTQGSQTYTTQIGNYIKTGNLVVLNFDIITTVNTGSGNVTIAGLPFTSANQTGYQGSLQSTDFAGAGQQEVYTGVMSGSSSNIALYAYYVSGSSLLLKRATAADMGANLSIGGTITYISDN